MKSLTVFVLVGFTVAAMIYTGLNAMASQNSFGLFMTFVGSSAAVGLTIDIFNHYKPKRKQSA